MSDPLLDSLALTVLDGLPSARGRRNADVGLEFVRELNAGDLDVLLNPPPKGMQTSALKQIRHKHHLLARLVAESKSGTEISYITGYSLSRISILKNDPAFKELVEYYQQNVQEVYLDVHQRIADLGLAAADELHERLEDNPKQFTNRELLDITEKMLDRSGLVETPQKGGGPVAISVSFVASPNANAAKPELVEELPIDVEIGPGG